MHTGPANGMDYVFENAANLFLYTSKKNPNLVIVVAGNVVFPQQSLPGFLFAFIQ